MYRILWSLKFIFGPYELKKTHVANLFLIYLFLTFSPLSLYFFFSLPLSIYLHMTPYTHEHTHKHTHTHKTIWAYLYAGNIIHWKKNMFQFMKVFFCGNYVDKILLGNNNTFCEMVDLFLRWRELFFMYCMEVRVGSYVVWHNSTLCNFVLN